MGLGSQIASFIEKCFPSKLIFQCPQFVDYLRNSSNLSDLVLAFGKGYPYAVCSSSSQPDPIPNSRQSCPEMFCHGGCRFCEREGMAKRIAQAELTWSYLFGDWAKAEIVVQASSLKSPLFKWSPIHKDSYPSCSHIPQQDS